MRQAHVPRRRVAGGAGARSGLIERLRVRIRAIEQAPVSPAAPPTVDTGAPRPACPSFGSSAQAHPLWHRQDTPPSPRCAGDAGGEPVPAFPHPAPGIEAIERALPWGGLGAGGLHEIRAASYADGWAALGFALALIARRRGTGASDAVLWVLTDAAAHELGAPYGPGLARFGIDPGQLLVARVRRRDDLAWTLEEGLKSRALGAVLGQADALPDLQARRLSLAARSHRTPCLLVLDHRAGGVGPALTRWRVSAARSAAPMFDRHAPGLPRWSVALERCRHGPEGREWVVEWDQRERRMAERAIPAFAGTGREGNQEAIQIPCVEQVAPNFRLARVSA